MMVPGTIGGPRVVLLSQDAALRQVADVAVVRCVTVETGYEAAAELLSEPASALVVDLSILTARHARLLEIARGQNVEVLGVGMPNRHLDPESLSGLRLVSRNDLAGVLNRMTQAQGADQRHPEVDQSHPEANQRPPEASGGLPAAPSTYIPAPLKAPTSLSAPTPTKAPARASNVQPVPAPVSPPAPVSRLVGRYQSDAPMPPDRPQLTDEELAALTRPGNAEADEFRAGMEDAEVVEREVPAVPQADVEQAPAASVAPVVRGEGNGQGKEEATFAGVRSPQDLLSPEELTALLEDQR